MRKTDLVTSRKCCVIYTCFKVFTSIFTGQLLISTVGYNAKFCC